MQLFHSLALQSHQYDGPSAFICNQHAFSACADASNTSHTTTASRCQTWRCLWLLVPCLISQNLSSTSSVPSLPSSPSCHRLLQGEPLLNVPAVVQSYKLINEQLGIGGRSMTISTVGEAWLQGQGRAWATTDIAINYGASFKSFDIRVNVHL